VVGGLGKLHNEELRNLGTSPNVIVIKSRRIRWAGHVTRIEEKRNGYSALVVKPEGMRQLGGPRRRWYDKIRIDLRVEECGLDTLAQNRDQ